MTSTAFSRRCPRCSTQFDAATERGVCPSCNLFSRVRRDGVHVGVSVTFDTPELPDWPHGPIDILASAMFSTFADGGGPLVVSDRYDDYPAVSVVHQQLLAYFESFASSVNDQLPSGYHRGDGSHHSLPTDYANATEIHLLTWDDAEHHYDLICYLTDDGGHVDALLDHDAYWHANGG